MRVLVFSADRIRNRTKEWVGDSSTRAEGSNYKNIALVNNGREGGILFVLLNGI